MRVLLMFFAVLFMSDADFQDDYEKQRKRMVRTQIEARGVSHGPTLKAMRRVPRHLFVSPGFRQSAYFYIPLPIVYDQTISQPYIVAFMTSEVKSCKGDRVLEIGTGSGYQAAVLAEIVDSVYTIEIVEPLGKEARKRLHDLEYKNVEVRVGDGYHGWPEKGPFDAIIVTARIDTIPKPLLDQLKVGGRMMIPVGPSNTNSQLMLVTRTRDGYKREARLPVSFVPFTRKKN